MTSHDTPGRYGELTLSTVKRRKISCVYFPYQLDLNVVILVLRHLTYFFSFLPRCMECQRALATRKLSPSVRSSVWQTSVICDKTKDRSVQIFIPHERTFSLVFWEEKCLVGATTSTWNFYSRWPRWSEIAHFQSLFARSTSVVASSKKV